MKTIFTIFFTITFSSLVLGQSIQPILDSIERSKGVLRSKKEFGGSYREMSVSESTDLLLDSIIYMDWDESSDQLVNFTKGVYTNDEKGNIILHFTGYWDNNNKQWKHPYFQEKYSYDENNNIVLNENYYWSTSKNLWIGNRNIKNEWFNDKDKIKIVNYYTWDNDIYKWTVLDYKEEYSYDTNGNILLKEKFPWSEEDNDWLAPNNQTEYTYDDEGNKIFEFRNRFDENSNQWIKTNFDKTEYSYDNNRRIILEINYDWNISDKKWKENTKIESAYDAEGNKILLGNYIWDERKGDWSGTSKYEYLIKDGKKIQSISYKWNDVIKQWESPLVKRLYTYDENKNITLEQSYKWDENINDWGNMYHKVETSYINGKILVENSYSWDDNPGFWYNSFRKSYYYSENTTTGIISNIENKIRVYPNPGTNVLFFESDAINENCEVELYDIQGRKVLTFNVHHDTYLNISTLQRGLYIYKYISNEKTQTGKIILN